MKARYSKKFVKVTHSGTSNTGYCPQNAEIWKECSTFVSSTYHIKKVAWCFGSSFQKFDRYHTQEKRGKSFLDNRKPIRVSDHLPEKWRHFVFSKTFLCFRVRVRVGGNRFKYVFGKMFIRANALDPPPPIRYWLSYSTFFCENTELRCFLRKYWTLERELKLRMNDENYFYDQKRPRVAKGLDVPLPLTPSDKRFMQCSETKSNL